MNPGEVFFFFFTPKHTKTSPQVKQNKKTKTFSAHLKKHAVSVLSNIASHVPQPYPAILEPGSPVAFLPAIDWIDRLAHACTFVELCSLTLPIPVRGRDIGLYHAVAVALPMPT